MDLAGGRLQNALTAGNQIHFAENIGATILNVCHFNHKLDCILLPKKTNKGMNYIEKLKPYPYYQSDEYTASGDANE